MTLSGARAIIRASQNPTCEVLLGMVVVGVREVEFYQQVMGETYPREYGERLSARKRGLAFEANLHRNNAFLLREAVARCHGLEPADMSVVNLDVVAGTDSTARLDYTRHLLQDLAAGKPVPDIVVQPQFELPIGPTYSVGIRPDFLHFNRSDGMYQCGELKSFIVRAGIADKSDLVGTRLQAAIEIEALRAEAMMVGLSNRVRNHAVFVFATPYGLQPHPAVVERLDGPIREVRRALAALAVFKHQLDTLNVTDSSHLAQFGPTFNFNYQEACIGTCVLADVCKARVLGSARSLGDSAADYLGADTNLKRLDELMSGAMPADQFEVEMRNALLAAARTLGFDTTPVVRSP